MCNLSLIGLMVTGLSTRTEIIGLYLLITYGRAMRMVLTVGIFKIELSKFHGKVSEYD